MYFLLQSSIIFAVYASNIAYHWTPNGYLAGLIGVGLAYGVLRHACGFALANKGHDTRALQAYLGHRNIQHTVRYTELSPDRFKNFWR